MMVEASIRDVLVDLKSRIGAVAVALIARDGQLLFADLPEGLLAETFGVMCATTFGAALTVQSELGRTLPERVVIVGNDSATIVVECGPHAILVAMVERATELPSTIGEVSKVATFLEPR